MSFQQKKFLPRLSQILWILALLFALGWYGKFRVIEPMQSEPFSAGFNGNDFKHVYLGAWMLVNDMDPYDAQALLDMARGRGLGAINPYVYLPFTGLVLSPLTLFDPPGAMRVWFVLNHLFLFGALALIFLSLRIRFDLPNITISITLVALCYPLHRTLTAGQLNCALLFLFALVFWLQQRNRFIFAGAAAAFAFLFKLIPGILLVYFVWRGCDRFVLTRKMRNPYWIAAISMVAFTALFLGISILWVGVDRHLAFRPLLSEMSYGHSTWSFLGQRFYRDPANQSFNSFFHHIIAPLPDSGITPWLALGAEWADNLTRLTTLVCWAMAGIAGLITLRRAGNNSVPSSDRLAYGIVILLGLLTPSIYWDHYAVIALWPLMAFYAQIKHCARGAVWTAMFALAFALGAFLELSSMQLGGLLIAAAGAMLFLVARFRWHGMFAVLWVIAASMLDARFLFALPAFHQGPGLLAMSLKLWATLLLFAMCLACIVKDKDIQSE